MTDRDAFEIASLIIQAVAAIGTPGAVWGAFAIARMSTMSDVYSKGPPPEPGG